MFGICEITELGSEFWILWDHLARVWIFGMCGITYLESEYLATVGSLSSVLTALIKAYDQ